MHTLLALALSYGTFSSQAMAVAALSQAKDNVTTTFNNIKEKTVANLKKLNIIKNKKSNNRKAMNAQIEEMATQLNSIKENKQTIVKAWDALNAQIDEMATQLNSIKENKQTIVKAWDALNAQIDEMATRLNAIKENKQ